MTGSKSTLRRATLAALLLPLLLGGCLAGGGGPGIRPVLLVERSGWTQAAPVASDDEPVRPGRWITRGKVVLVTATRPIRPLQVASAGGGALGLPIAGAVLTSYFGMREHPILGEDRMHGGIDLAAPSGTPIGAAADGVIGAAGPNGGYGNYVRVDHAGGLSTGYAHLSRFATGIAEGRAVRAGEVIGYVGTTGLSTGPHLHFEAMRAGRSVDPLALLPDETRLALIGGGDFQLAQARGGR